MTFGSGDSDALAYDSGTGRMTQYKFTVNGSSVTGNLTWNQNGTLQQLAITDPFDSANQQTCTYAYDDLARIGNVNCLNPQSQPIWTQAFTPPDAFGNVQKTGSNGGTSWLPTYTTPPTNQYSSIPGVTGPYYDSNGNVIKDGFHSYTWDAEGLPHSVDNLGFTYDALGRAVEDSGGTQLVYSPLGARLGFMSGQTFQTGRVPLVAGAWARYLASGLAVYRHPDWLGSVRLSSTPSQGQPYYDGAYAPYGESYAEWGTTDHQFTGQREDTVGDLYDFPFREYHPTQGRWLSPDPAGLAAADPTNPQSLNRYAYVLNRPTGLVDPLGLLYTVQYACYNPMGMCAGNATTWAGSEGGLAAVFAGFEGTIVGYLPGTDLPIIDIEPMFQVISLNMTSWLADYSGGPAGGLATPANNPAPCTLQRPLGNYAVGPNAVALFQPPMAASISSALTNLNNQGIVPMITSGFRTAAGQSALQNSPYGAAQVSWHQVGMAVDINSNTPNFAAIAAAMTGSGLTWGGTFTHPDPVHFQGAAGGTTPSAAQVTACANVRLR